MNESTFKPGDAARIRQSIHSPYPGQTGMIMSVDHADSKGPYQVLFSDGLQFRYRAEELEPHQRDPHSHVVESLFRVIHETRQGRRRNTHLR